MITAQAGGKVVSLTHRAPLPPENAPGTHFGYRLSRLQGHSAIGRILCQWKIPVTPAVLLRSQLGNIKKKVKWSHYRPGVAQRVGRGIAILFHDRGTRRGWVVSSTPRPHFTPGKIRYPLYRRLGGPQGRSVRAENLIPTGVQSRFVQPELSNPAHKFDNSSYL